MSIKALAQQLDISIGTVSRALNGRADVNPETRKRVLAAAEAMGYVPNQSGRSLRQGTTNVIGFTMETNVETKTQGDTFFMSVFDGVQTVFARHKLDLVVLPCASDDDPFDHVRRVVSRQFVDGLILSATQRHDPRIGFLIERGVPFVTLGRSLSVGEHPWIDMDFEGVAAQSVARLVERGHRRIALANTERGVNLSYLFEDAYRSALASHGIDYDPNIVLRGEITELGGYQVCERLLSLEAPPTAAILVNESLAMGFYRCLHDAGLTPGRDMAIIGFRQNPQSRFLSPALTCYRLSLHDLGVELAQSLLATMPAHREQYPQSLTQKIWPLELVAGESDPPPRA